MKCLEERCVYQADGACSRPELISINEVGICAGRVFRSFVRDRSSQIRKSPAKSTSRDKCKSYLESQLTGSSIPASEIIADAKSSGHSEHSLRRAFKDLGGQTKKTMSVNGCWEWSLPTAANPGSREKIEAMRKRAEEEGELFVEGDETIPVPIPGKRKKV